MGSVSQLGSKLQGTDIASLGSPNTTQPRGHLVALPTKAEVEAHLQTVEAFVTTVPIQSASTILKSVDAAICQDNNISLHHLRRFVRPEHLPLHLTENSREDHPQSGNTDFAGLSGSYGTSNDDSSIVRTDHSAQCLYFLICSTSTITFERLRTLLLSTESQGCQINPYLRVISVPLFPPSSEAQAKRWSQEYWPTAYKGGNPFGPHPTLVARAAQEVQKQADYFMSIAKSAALSISIDGKGEPFGALVVDRSQKDDAAIIVAAGDARWEGVGERSQHACGNVMAHAVMRAIAMVAKKRRSTSEDNAQVACEPNSFVEQPLTQIERDAYAKTTMEPGGYLCLDLELYVTHEPCVMCCMAINHSRFSRVIFGERMPLTGGLNARPSSGSSDLQYGGYGLWWRPELNWKFLVWHWDCDNNWQVGSCDEAIHV